MFVVFALFLILLTLRLSTFQYMNLLNTIDLTEKLLVNTRQIIAI